VLIIENKIEIPLTLYLLYMLKIYISIIVVFGCTLTSAQSDSISSLNKSAYSLKLSYNSSLIYPGMSAGIDIPLKALNAGIVVKYKKNRFIARERLISGNINWYHHPYFHDNLYLTVEWVMRRTNSNGLVSEFACGPGLSRTFLGGTTYRVSESGEVSVVKLAGYTYALFTIGGGIGYDFSVKKKKPISAVAKMNLISMFPYNSTVYVRPVLELGVRCSPYLFAQRSLNK
jgi:hypothetical protein